MLNVQTPSVRNSNKKLNQAKRLQSKDNVSLSNSKKEEFTFKRQSTIKTKNNLTTKVIKSNKNMAEEVNNDSVSPTSDNNLSTSRKGSKNLNNSIDNQNDV